LKGFPDAFPENPRQVPSHVLFRTGQGGAVRASHGGLPQNLSALQGQGQTRLAVAGFPVSAKHHMFARCAFAVIFLSSLGCAFGQDIKVVKGDTTSADKYAEFIFDGIDFRNDGIKIYGRVKNVSGVAIYGVRVAFTVKDKNGEFINRGWNFSSPSEMGPKETGFVEDIIRTKGKTVVIIEWSISDAHIQ
jgi:hypothetical protein